MASARNDPRAGSRRQAGQIAELLEVFFELSDALSLSAAETQALLDVSAEIVTRLRAGPPDALQLDRAKLKRRLDYAIPILERMIASLAS